MTTPAWIGLGSNLGDRRAILDSALAGLAEVPGVVVRAASSYHETRPVGGPPGQGPFLNAAARLETSLEPHRLLAALQAVEVQAGRVRTVRWGERTLDLDILIYGTRFLDEEELKLPHPRLALRRFVLAPLAEIAPNVADTMTRRTIADLLANLDRRPRLVALLGPPGPAKTSIFRGLLEHLPASGLEVEGRDAPLGRGARPGEAFARRVVALRADRWDTRADREAWGVATFFLDPRSIDPIANSPPDAFQDDGPMAEWAARKMAEAEWRERIRRAKAEAARAIFVVILPGDPAMTRRPGLLSIPQLRPESDDPDAIVAEVVATCRDIEGV